MTFTTRLLMNMLLATFATAAHAVPDCADLVALGDEIAKARDTDPGGAVARGTEALKQVADSALPCPIGKAMVLGGIATNLSVLGSSNEAVRRFEEAIAILGTSGAPSQTAFLHRGLGVALVALESYEAALRHYNIALVASEADGDKIESAKTAGNIGIIYNTLGELEQSRSFHSRSLADFEAADFKLGIAGALVNLGAVAAKFGESALIDGDVETARREHLAVKELNERALALFDELHNPRGIAYAAANVGLALERLGEPKKALLLHQRSLALRREVGDAYGILNSLLSLTSTLTTLKRYDEAKAKLDEVASLTPQDSLNMRQAAAEHRVTLDEARGDYRGALAAQREVTQLTALMAHENQRSEVTALQSRINAETSAKQIEALRNAAVDSGASLQQQHLLLQLSAIAILAALGMFVVMLSRYRNGVASARLLQIAARSDPLTGLPNRRHLKEMIDAEAIRVAHGGVPFALLMADIDDFKQINDRYGHDGGDAVLIEVARRLREAIREQGSVARWGGEEFLLLLPQSDGNDAQALAEKLRVRISTSPFEIPGASEALAMTITIGYSEYRPGMSIDDAIKAADAGLYHGKRQGKNRTASLQDDHGSAADD